MTDEELIGLYFSRNEEAIAGTKAKYGSYLGMVAGNILRNTRDTEECLNDAYLAAWNSIPPNMPENLQTYLGKHERHILPHERRFLQYDLPRRHRIR